MAISSNPNPLRDRTPEELKEDVRSFYNRNAELQDVVCAACVIGTAHCHSWQETLACRLLLGIGIGAKASIAPVFAVAVAAEYLRGRLLMMWQLKFWRIPREWNTEADHFAAEQRKTGKNSFKMSWG